MSPESRNVSVTQNESGRWLAMDQATGTTSEGDSVGVALLGLGLKLGLDEADDGRTLDELLDSLAEELGSEPSFNWSRARLESLAERVRARFDAQDVSEKDVEDAIRWARQE